PLFVGENHEPADGAMRLEGRSPTKRGAPRTATFRSLQCPNGVGVLNIPSVWGGTDACPRTRRAICTPTFVRTVKRPKGRGPGLAAAVASPTSLLQRSLSTDSVGAVNDSLPPCAASGCGQPELCPLNQVQAGTAVRIKQLAAPPEVSHRLRELGFCEEQQVRLVSKHVNVICQVCNARLGLSHQL